MDVAESSPIWFNLITCNYKELLREREATLPNVSPRSFSLRLVVSKPSCLSECVVCIENECRAFPVPLKPICTGGDAISIIHGCDTPG